ncbi:MAG TPA: hypothetical protein VK970_04795 [Candidatus Methylacidiphilales bacterium]|nr:hypothetical protein [Candidatus Methylacidiphilales bacterium]
MVIQALTVSWNYAVGNDHTRGGGISSENGNVTIINAEISHNTADAVGSSSVALGGGIYIEGSTLELTGVLVSENTANSRVHMGYGGGMYIGNSGSGTTTTILNSTITANHITARQAGRGGGIYSYGSLTMGNSTLSNNTVTASSTLSGGALYSEGSGSTSRSTTPH